MSTIRIIFTKRKYNVVSWLIRWALPKSRFHMADASHCMVVDGDYIIEASMMHGVRRTLRALALDGQYIVYQHDYMVHDRDAGLTWLRTQVGKRYDFKGALGLSLAPDRQWQSEEDWFCFELAASCLAKAGRNMFSDNAHITGTMLESILD